MRHKVDPKRSANASISGMGVVDHHVLCHASHVAQRVADKHRVFSTTMRDDR